MGKQSVLDELQTLSQYCLDVLRRTFKEGTYLGLRHRN